MTGATNSHIQVVSNVTFALFAALRNRLCKSFVERLVYLLAIR
jgi:hypothetical protein